MTTNVSEALGTLEHLDPNVLELDANVRDDPALTKQFIANIAENGVLVPLTAVRTDTGAVLVRTGQRRTLAAREAGLPTVPVYVLPVNGEHENAARVIEQIVENDHRAGLTATQRVFGIQQLLDTGMSVTKVAKRLAVSAERVKASKAVAGSQDALNALRNEQMSLAEAAVLAEFDGDERAAARLLGCAGRPQFDHVAAQLRAEKVSAQALADEEARCRAEGYAVLTEQPSSFDRYHIQLGYLLKDGEPATVEAVTDPKHWAVLICEGSVLVDNDTGEVVDEDDVDWDTQDRPDQEPGEGLRHADKVTETVDFGPEFYCTDHEAAGLRPNERFAKFSGMAATGDGGEPLSREDAAANRAAAAAALDEKVEAEKRERRRVLALNRLGDAALSVRRDFVRKLLTRKSPPKGAAVFVARTLSRDGYLLTNHKADEITADLLGVTHIESHTSLDGGMVKGIDKLVDALGEGGDARAQVITLGLVLGALEGRTPKDAWREHHSSQWAVRFVGAREYLAFLADNGYQLSDVEQVITGAKTADEVYDQYVAEK